MAGKRNLEHFLDDDLCGAQEVGDEVQQAPAKMGRYDDDCCGVKPPCSCCQPVPNCCPPCCPVPNCCPCPCPPPCCCKPPCCPNAPPCPGTCPTPNPCPCKGCVYPEPVPPCPPPTPPAVPIPPCGCIPTIKPRPCCCCPPCCIPEPCTPPCPPPMYKFKCCDDVDDTDVEDGAAVAGRRCDVCDDAGFDDAESKVQSQGYGKDFGATLNQCFRLTDCPPCMSPPPCRIPAEMQAAYDAQDATACGQQRSCQRYDASHQ